MSKAQAGQVIVYVLAIVIFAMVLIFGYKAIVNLRQQTDQASYLSFQKSLESDIKSIYFDYGSIKKESYSVRGYKQVCFADLGEDLKPPISSNPENPIVLNSIDSKVKKNVFLVNGNVDSFYIEKIWLGNPSDISYKNPLCVDVINGKLNIQLTGQGDSALVERS